MPQYSRHRHWTKNTITEERLKGQQDKINGGVCQVSACSNPGPNNWSCWFVYDEKFLGGGGGGRVVDGEVLAVKGAWIGVVSVRKGSFQKPLKSRGE